jgi:hypothetical protein
MNRTLFFVLSISWATVAAPLGDEMNLLGLFTDSGGIKFGDPAACQDKQQGGAKPDLRTASPAADLFSGLSSAGILPKLPKEQEKWSPHLRTRATCFLALLWLPGATLGTYARFVFPLARLRNIERDEGVVRIASVVKKTKESDELYGILVGGFFRSFDDSALFLNQEEYTVKWDVSLAEAQQVAQWHIDAEENGSAGSGCVACCPVTAWLHDDAD